MIIETIFRREIIRVEEEQLNEIEKALNRYYICNVI